MKKTNFKLFFIFILLIASSRIVGQSFTLSNEEAIFSFITENGKKVTLNRDTGNKYIIYRFGTNNKIEFAFPNKTKNSWQSFTYSFYLRGGGTQNEGMDLNYVYFVNKGFKYVLYDTYFAGMSNQKLGIKIIDLTIKKETNIRGKRKTKKGTLVGFRDTNLLKIGDELFD